MAIDDQIRELRTAISQQMSKTARAAVELDSAKENDAEARRVLKEDFGVETTDEARAKLAELQAELDNELKQAEQALAEAGG